MSALTPTRVNITHKHTSVSKHTDAHITHFRYTTPNSFGFSAEAQVQLDEEDVSTSMCSGRLGWALSGAGGFRAGCACSGCPEDKDLSASIDGSEFLKVVYRAP